MIKVKSGTVFLEQVFQLTSASTRAAHSQSLWLEWDWSEQELRSRNSNNAVLSDGLAECYLQLVAD